MIILILVTDADKIDPEPTKPRFNPHAQNLHILTNYIVLTLDCVWMLLQEGNTLAFTLKYR